MIAKRVLPFLLLALVAGANAQQSAALVAKWKKSVVTIQTGERTGAGFFTMDGLLFAPYSLFEGNSSAVVLTTDGKQGKVTGVVRASRDLDVVVLQTDLNRSGPALGDFAAVKPGDKVVVLSPTSHLDDVVSLKASNNIGSDLQLETAVTPDYSGCPVLNMKGDVVGMIQANNPSAATGSKDLKSPWTQSLAEVFGTGRAGDVATVGTLLATDKGVVSPSQAQPLQNPDNFAGIDDLQVLVDPIPDVLRSDLTTDAVRQWVEPRLAEYGIRVANSADKGLEFDVAQPKTQLQGLAAADSRMRSIEISVSAVKRAEGGVSYLVTATLLRACFIHPGRYALGAVGQEWVLGYTSEQPGYKIQTSTELCVRRLLQRIKAAP